MKRILFGLCVAAGLILTLSLSHNVVTAQSTSPWTTFYYTNTDWAGNWVFSDQVPAINYNWHGVAPAPGLPTQNWSMTATTTSFFYGGTYGFTALADDEVVVSLDNQIVIDTRGRNQVGKQQLVYWGVVEGNHTVTVNYRQFCCDSYLQVFWSIYKPSGPTPAPPPPNLQFPVVPASATSVVTPFGDYTPCIQQNLHQSKCFVANGEWNAPNLGSIEMEPQITVWGKCEPADKDTTWTTNANTSPVQTGTFRCSKTLAGWFPTS